MKITRLSAIRNMHSAVAEWNNPAIRAPHIATPPHFQVGWGAVRPPTNVCSPQTPKRVITRRQDGNAPTPAITDPDLLGLPPRLTRLIESMMNINKHSAMRNRHEPIIATSDPTPVTHKHRSKPMIHRPNILTTLPRALPAIANRRTYLRHLLAPFAIAAMLLGLAGNANAQALSFGAEPSIDDQVYTVGQAVNVTLPQATGGVAPLTYSLTRTNGNAIPPPRGVVINPTNRTLIGTPVQVAEAVSYRWTVTDSASPVVMQHIPFTITVNAAPVENIAPAFVAGASIGAATFYQDTDITPLTLPRATGGEGAITYALTPAIPGMFFDTVTGVLSGAPTTEAAATTYTYTAGDTDGSAPGTDEASLTISITVLANTIPDLLHHPRTQLYLHRGHRGQSDPAGRPPAATARSSTR